jgi:prefoldin subunit 5
MKIKKRIKEIERNLELTSSAINELSGIFQILNDRVLGNGVYGGHSTERLDLLQTQFSDMARRMNEILSLPEQVNQLRMKIDGMKELK